MENTKQHLEIADIFCNHADNFLKNHNLCLEQLKAFNSIMHCRTNSLGGHIEQCDHCGHTRHAYNSCRNRHCPKCQFVKKAQWVDQLGANLPPTKHFHVVFTIPECLHKIFYINQKKAYSLLFNAAAKALMQCAANPDFLGVQAGAVAILHTWGQTLVYHPHIHMIVPAGGLSEDQMEWIYARKKFFVPVRALSAIFRGILCRLIEQEVEQKSMILPDDYAEFKSLKNKCYEKNWVVYCEKPFSNKDNLIQYLGNYTHRVAISNHRIVSNINGKVSFTYKDYKTGGVRKTMSLDANEFIRRFLQHVLPSGFYKIRYFGFMAICNMQTKLAICFDLIGKATFLSTLKGLNALDVLRNITEKNPFCCKICGKGNYRNVIHVHQSG